MGHHTALTGEGLTKDIIHALALRHKQETRFTLEETHLLLVLRVRTDAERAGVSPRALMGAVQLIALVSTSALMTSG